MNDSPVLEHTSAADPAAAITSRHAWVEVDLAAARTNLAAVRSQVGEDRILIAVIKGNAYGHGAVELARTYAEAGVERFAVATVPELLELRQGGITQPVLILGHVPEEAMAEALSAGAEFSLYSSEQAKAISKAACEANITARLHVKVDTGMGRLGFLPTAESVAQLKKIKTLPNLEIIALFSHFATADDADSSYQPRQWQRFCRFRAACEEAGLSFSFCHMANSATISCWPDMLTEGVRAGIILYGCYGNENEPRLPGVKTLMSVHAKVVSLRTLEPGDTLGYGCTWQAKETSRIALLPIGYADGMPWALSNNGEVLLHGRRVPIVGRICMDYLMLDVTALEKEHPIAVGDEAVVMGTQGDDTITAEELAARCGSFNYEVLCRFGLRLEKIYRG